MRIDPLGLLRADADALSAAWNAGVVPESGMYREMSPEEFAERLAGRTGVASDLLVTAEDAGELEGFAVGCTTGFVDKREANLAALVVAPQHRRKGTGTHLLEAFEKQAKRAGCMRIQISPASHVRFAFGVDPRTFAYKWLWRHGYAVCQSHLYMRTDLVGWTIPDASQASIDRLREAGIDFRPAEPRDLGALIACARVVSPRMADVFDRNARRPGPLPVLIAVRGDEVVGFIGPLWVTPCGIPDFEFIAVLERERGKGFGSALFTLTMESFARSGAEVMELMTGLDNPAQRIYFAAGFGCQHAFACFAKDLVT